MIQLMSKHLVDDPPVRRAPVRKRRKSKVRTVPPQHGTQAPATTHNKDTIGSVTAEAPTQPQAPEQRQSEHGRITSTKSSTCVLRPEFVVVGINQVARGLERGQIRAVVTCKDVRPAGLMQHLFELTRDHGIPHCQLRGVQRVLGHLFRVKRFNALGILSASGGRNIDVDELCGMIEAFSVHRDDGKQGDRRRMKREHK